MKHYFLPKACTVRLQIYWKMFRHCRNCFKLTKSCQVRLIYLESKYKPRLIWKCLKELLMGKSKASPKGLLIYVHIITDELQMTNTFNNYFTAIG